MKNNFYNIPNDWYKEFNQTFDTMGIADMNNMGNMMNKMDDVGAPTVGFMRGNLFDNLYTPYKNYTYGKLRAMNEKDELLYRFLMYKFALVELDLYLDNYPNDKRMMELYRQYLREEKKLTKQYEDKYGPLTLGSEAVLGNDFEWIESPWPWEGNK